MKHSPLAGFGALAAMAALTFLSGCNNAPPVTPMTAAQLQQKQQEEIAQIQNDPKIPPDKKASLLAMIQHPDPNANRPGPPRTQ